MKSDKGVSAVIAVLLMVVIAFAIVVTFFPTFLVEGEKRDPVTYTGVLLEFDIDCEQCCHPSSYFKINTSDGVKSELIGNCDKNLEQVVHVGKTYSIRIEPYAEPSALTHHFFEAKSFWCVQIDWIKDSNGNLIYGSDFII